MGCGPCRWGWPPLLAWTTVDKYQAGSNGQQWTQASSLRHLLLVTFPTLHSLGAITRNKSFVPDRSALLF